MHLFKLNTLLYLSLHALGLFFGVIAALGIPGTEKSSNIISILNKLLDFLFVLVWQGIPVLFIISAVLFFLEYDFWAKMVSFVSLGLGIVLCLTMLIFYYVKD